MKVGRHLDKVKEALAAPACCEGAVLVENVDPAARSASGRSPPSTEQQVPYFSLIIAGRKRAPAHELGDRPSSPSAPRSAALAKRLRDAAARQRRSMPRPAPTARPTSASRRPTPHLAGLFARPVADRRPVRQRHPDPGRGAAAAATRRDEPPVVAVAEDGSAVVPLLGGHHGANELARRDRGELWAWRPR